MDKKIRKSKKMNMTKETRKIAEIFFKTMPQAKSKLPNVVKNQKQIPTPKLKCKIGPKVASISTYFKDKNNKETKQFKSSNSQQDVVPSQKFKPRKKTNQGRRK